MAPATAIERIRTHRCRAVMARAQRWRWRDRVSGQPFGAMFRRSIREDPTWAAAHLHWHRWLVVRREFDSAVGVALGTAHAAEVEAARARRAGVSVAALRVISGR